MFMENSSIFLLLARKQLTGACLPSLLIKGVDLTSNYSKFHNLS
jgi:hypothetical protein